MCDYMAYSVPHLEAHSTYPLWQHHDENVHREAHRCMRGVRPGRTVFQTDACTYYGQDDDKKMHRDTRRGMCGVRPGPTVLKGDASVHYEQDADEIGYQEALRSLCRVTSVGTLCVVLARWAPCQAQTRDPSFLLLSTRMLFSFVQASNSCESDLWCKLTAAHGLSVLFGIPSMWHSLSKKAQADVLR